MIRKYHNHTLQTNPRHREEDSQNTNSHNTPGRQLNPLESTLSTSPITEPPQTMGATINN